MRNRSQELTFRSRVAESIQNSYGRPIALNTFVETRVFETAFQSLTSRAPLHARFLDPVGFFLSGGG